MTLALTIWFATSVACIALALLTPERLIPELVDEPVAPVATETPGQAVAA